MVERSKRIELRVTEDELMKIRDRMEEAGISGLTAYLVRMSIHGYVIVMDLSDLKVRLLQILGNNLNQYAKKQMKQESFTMRILKNRKIIRRKYYMK